MEARMTRSWLAPIVAALSAALALSLPVAAMGAANAHNAAPSLKVAVFFSNAAFAHVYIAQVEGYFKQAGVNVSFVNDAGSNTLPLVVSGQADLGMIGAGAPLLAAKGGKDTSIIYAHIGNMNGGVVVAKPTVNWLSDMHNVGATGPGSSSYGFCQYYNRVFHLGWNITPFADVPTLLAALDSGRVDGACNSYTNFLQPITTHKVHVIVDTRTRAVRAAVLGPDFPEAAIFGLTANLQAKRDAVVRFLWAVRRAEQFVVKQPATKVASDLHTLSNFKATPVAGLVDQVRTTLPYYAPNGGFISSGVWEFALSQYAQWGIGIDPNDSVFSYGNRVDMSYYRAALKKP